MHQHTRRVQDLVHRLLDQLGLGGLDVLGRRLWVVVVFVCRRCVWCVRIAPLLQMLLLRRWCCACARAQQKARGVASLCTSQAQYRPAYSCCYELLHKHTLFLLLTFRGRCKPVRKALARNLPSRSHIRYKPLLLGLSSPLVYNHAPCCAESLGPLSMCRSRAVVLLLVLQKDPHTSPCMYREGAQC
jgi:hypothetical protein